MTPDTPTPTPAAERVDFTVLAARIIPAAVIFADHEDHVADLRRRAEIELCSAFAALTARAEKAEAELAEMRVANRHLDQCRRRLEAACRVARGWIITASSSKLARSDLRTLDAALMAFRSRRAAAPPSTVTSTSASDARADALEAALRVAAGLDTDSAHGREG